MMVPFLNAARYMGDFRLAKALEADELIAAKLQAAAVPARRAEVRLDLLANCLRLDARLIPKAHAAFEHVRERITLDQPMEAYVFDSPSVNAWVTESRDRLLVGLSSAAVNLLGEPELEFVLGHELGHTYYSHIKIPAKGLMDAMPDPRRRMQLMAWSRAAEISADRAGLLACRDLNAAARAMFQVLSGLRLDGAHISPTEFAEQWDLLADEVADAGADAHWQLTHPFLHLRVKAMILFGDVMSKQQDTHWPGVWMLKDVDSQVERLLAVMDPLAREKPDAADPMLAEFYLWGGLYIAVSHGSLGTAERDRLATVTSTTRLNEALASGTPPADVCLAQFRDAIVRRRSKLRAAEIFRIMEGLVEIARCDGQFSAPEQKALRAIAAALGVNADLIIAQHVA